MICKNRNSYGIPQGSPISATLSNVYMLDFDQRIHDYMKKIGGSYYRYCDDMIFILDQEYKEQTISYASNEITKIRASINEEKTEIVDFTFSDGKQSSNKPLQYLGFTYDGQKILLRSSALSRFSSRMRRGVKLAKMTRDKQNLRRLEYGLAPKGLYKRKLYNDYSHLGRRNFLSYGYRASEKMDSKHIRKQLKPLWERLQIEIRKK